MVTVVFHFNDFDPTYGLESPHNHIKEWIQNSIAFGVDELIMIDKTQFKVGQYYHHPIFNIKFKRYDSLNVYIQENLNRNIVLFESEYGLQNTGIIPIKLHEHEHQEDVIYVFGPDFGVIEILEEYNSLVDWVEIEMVNSNPLYAKGAACIALHDRIIKNK